MHNPAMQVPFITGRRDNQSAHLLAGTILLLRAGGVTRKLGSTLVAPKFELPVIKMRPCANPLLWGEGYAVLAIHCLDEVG